MKPPYGGSIIMVSTLVLIGILHHATSNDDDISNGFSFTEFSDNIIIDNHPDRFLQPSVI